MVAQKTKISIIVIGASSLEIRNSRDLKKIFVLSLLSSTLLASSAGAEVTQREIVNALAVPSTISSGSNAVQRPSGRLTPRTTKPSEDLNTNSLSPINWINILSTANPPRIALEINFEVGTAEIIESDRYVISIIAQALRSPSLIGQAILIAGHTDTSGSEAFNMTLSTKRAEAIKLQLVNDHGIDAKRLITVGFGEMFPLANLNAEDPQNRRVELYNLSNMDG